MDVQEALQLLGLKAVQMIKLGKVQCQNTLNGDTGVADNSEENGSQNQGRIQKEFKDVSEGGGVCVCKWCL